MLFLIYFLQFKAKSNRLMYRMTDNVEKLVECRIENYVLCVQQSFQENNFCITLTGSWCCASTVAATPYSWCFLARKTSENVDSCSPGKSINLYLQKAWKERQKRYLWSDNWNENREQLSAIIDNWELLKPHANNLLTFSSKYALHG